MREFRATAAISVVVLLAIAAWAGAADEKTRAVPPDSKTLALEMQKVGSVYKEEIAAAKTGADKIILANKMLTGAADASAKSDEQYALCMKAVEIAIQAGEARTAFAAVDQINKHFAVDSVALEADTISKLAAAMKQSPDQNTLIARCDGVIDAAVLRERFDVARRVGEVAVSAARKLRDPAATKWAASRLSEVNAAQVASGKQKLALATLEHNAADPEANLTVGKYRCFVRDDWVQGLANLSRSADAQLKAIAARELAAGSDAAAKVAVADSWWDRAAKEQGLTRRRMQQHAIILYTGALPSLSGLDKTNAEKRIAQAPTAPALINTNGMTLNEVLARFTFPNKTFHIAGDCITGKSENCDNPANYIMLTSAEKLQSFEFGFAIKAKTHHMALVEMDGHRYLYSRGHWQNDHSALSGGKTNHLTVDGIVKSPNEWATIKVQVADDKMTFTYNGQVVGWCELAQPASKESTVKVGFSSSDCPMSIKDVYIIER